MRYRVAFTFWGSPGQVYYTEWFDTEGEAKRFTEISDRGGELFIYHIEDEDGEVI